jgi:dihydrofolate reductase
VSSVVVGQGVGMGVIRVHMALSLDGYFEGPDHDLSWHRVDAELHQHFNDVLRPSRAFVSGRVTYELMASYWPTADADHDAEPQEREFAGIWRETPKVVYSRTLESAAWGTEVQREVDPAAVRALAEEGDLVVGGADLAATFFRESLVDQVWLYVMPVVIGAGRRLFASGQALDLKLLGSQAFGNGVVELRYAVQR